MNYVNSKKKMQSIKKETLLMGVSLLTLCILLGIHLTRTSTYLYAYIEQFQLFQENGEYALRLASRPGGPMEYITTYLLQFFVYPGVGAGVTLLFWAASALALRQVCRRLMPQQEVPLLYLLPGLLAVLASFNFNYHWECTGSLVLTAWALAGYLRVKRPWLRLGVGVVSAWALFYLTGPAWLAAWLCFLLYEWLTDSRVKVAIGGATLLAMLPAVLEYQTGLAGEFRIAFLPDAYTNPRLPGQPLLYALWLSLPLVMGLAAWGRRLPQIRKRGMSNGVLLFQWLLMVGGLQIGIRHYESQSMTLVQELDYHVRYRQWDALLAAPLRSDQNALHAAYQNLALAEKGWLADQLLNFPQVGPEGLCPSWNRLATVSTLLSDIYYAMGQIGLSQRMAFEGMVASEWAVNPRLLLRLVQTNLILGNHAVARRYVRLLEETSTYKKQAAAFRVWLDRDEAVERDPELGGKRRFLQGAQGLTNLATVPGDLLQQVQMHPDAALPFDYVCAYFLLTKDVITWKQWLESTPPVAAEESRDSQENVLPATVLSRAQQSRPLPILLQEALIMMYENDPACLASKGVTESVRQRFEGFRRTLLEYRGSQQLASKLRSGYGHTFWYYYLFQK